jgi:hypothetical protein
MEAISILIFLPSSINNGTIKSFDDKCVSLIKFRIADD